MKDEIAINALLEVSKTINGKIPDDVLTQCYNIIQAHIFDSDSEIIIKMIEDIIEKHLNGMEYEV